MNSPVIIFSNDNFPVLMAFKLRFFILYFYYLLLKAAGGSRRSCCFIVCRPRALACGPAASLYISGTRHLLRCGPAGRHRYCYLSVVCRSSGEALPPELPPELLSPLIASSSAFVYPYPAEIYSTSPSSLVV